MRRVERVRAPGPQEVGEVGSVHWPRARRFEPSLARAYATLKDAGRPFEVVWLSEENDKADHANHLLKMPWLAVPYDAYERENALEHFKIQGRSRPRGDSSGARGPPGVDLENASPPDPTHTLGIPKLLIISPKGKVIEYNGTECPDVAAAFDAWADAASKM